MAPENFEYAGIAKYLEIPGNWVLPKNPKDPRNLYAMGILVIPANLRSSRNPIHRKPTFPGESYEIRVTWEIKFSKGVFRDGT